MTMPPLLRRTALTVHVLASVGWAGAVAAFLGLALTGLFGTGVTTVPAAYVAMDVLAWSVIVPLGLASVATGLAQSLGTPWGLFRHYWVLVKLVVSTVATGLLLLHLQPIGRVADAATAGPLAAQDLRGVRVQLVLYAAAALVALVVTTALSVFKPQGRTRYGRRARSEPRAASRA